MFLVCSFLSFYVSLISSSVLSSLSMTLLFPHLFFPLFLWLSYFLICSLLSFYDSLISSSVLSSLSICLSYFLICSFLSFYMSLLFPHLAKKHSTDWHYVTLYDACFSLKLKNNIWAVLTKMPVGASLTSSIWTVMYFMNDKGGFPLSVLLIPTE